MAAKKQMTKAELSRVLDKLEKIYLEFKKETNKVESGLGATKSVSRHMNTTTRKMNTIMKEIQAEMIKC